MWKRIAFAHVSVPLSVLHAIPPVREALDRMAQGWRPAGFVVVGCQVMETSIRVEMRSDG